MYKRACKLKNNLHEFSRFVRDVYYLSEKGIDNVENDLEFMSNEELDYCLLQFGFSPELSVDRIRKRCLANEGNEEDEYIEYLESLPDDYLDLHLEYMGFDPVESVRTIRDVAGINSKSTQGTRRKRVKRLELVIDNTKNNNRGVFCNEHRNIKTPTFQLKCSFFNSMDNYYILENIFNYIPSLFDKKEICYLSESINDKYYGYIVIPYAEMNIGRLKDVLSSYYWDDVNTIDNLAFTQYKNDQEEQCFKSLDWLASENNLGAVLLTPEESQNGIQILEQSNVKKHQTYYYGNEVYIFISGYS